MAKKLGSMAAVVQDPAAWSEDLERPIDFRAIDTDRPLEDQGPFDVILHKLSEDVRLMSISPEAERRIRELETYIERHPATVLVEHPRDIQKIVSRAETCRVLKRMTESLPDAAARPPRFVVVEDPAKINRADLGAILADSPFSYPIIGKPVAACGSSDSHKLIVAVNDEGLDLVNGPIVLQEYANHNGVLFKVYVLGDLIKVFNRPSLPNLGPKARNVAFDSQQPYPNEKDFGHEDGDDGWPVEMPAGVGTPRSADLSSPQTGVSGLEARIRRAAGQISRAFNLELFGFDVIVCRETGDLLVVDVNYFPSFKEVKGFPALLRDFLRRKALQGAGAQACQRCACHADTPESKPPPSQPQPALGKGENGVAVIHCGGEGGRCVSERR